MTPDSADLMLKKDGRAIAIATVTGVDTAAVQDLNDDNGSFTERVVAALTNEFGDDDLVVDAH